MTTLKKLLSECRNAIFFVVGVLLAASCHLPVASAASPKSSLRVAILQSGSQPVVCGQFVQHGTVQLPSTRPATALPLVSAHPQDLCTAPSETLSNSAVLGVRGNCTFNEKGTRAQSLGAQLLILSFPQGPDTDTFNHGNATAVNDSVSIPVIVVSTDDGPILAKWPDVAAYSPLRSSRLDLLAASVVFCIAVTTFICGAMFRLYTSRATALRDSALRASGQPVPAPEDEPDVPLDARAAFGMFVGACIGLLAIYFFFKYLVYFFIGVFALAGAAGLFCIMCPVLRMPDPYGPLPLPRVRMICLGAVCVALGVWWVIVRHNDMYGWILQDLLGFAFLVHFQRLLHFSNLKVATMFLLMFFFFDIFFVFITPFFTSDGTSVMESAALGDGSSTEQLPMLMRVPLFLDPYRVCGVSYTALGFGDIALPGLFASFCLVVDAGQQEPSDTNVPSPYSCLSKRVYFLTVSVAYVLGLITTYLALYLSSMAQPALLYLVPWTLGSVSLVAYFRGDFASMWQDGVRQRRADEHIPIPLDTMP